MLVISLVLALASLVFFMIWLPFALDLHFHHFHLSAADPDPTAIWLTVALVQRFCFVASMMACWKLIDVVRCKKPAAGSVAPA
jgi:hypothetical protein